MFKKQKEQSKMIVEKFMNHCATIIQSRFKGYQQRKYYKKFIPLYRRFKQLLYALFIGWKTRKILSLNLIKAKSNQIKVYNKNAKSAQCRIAKRDLSEEILRLTKNGSWVYYALKQNRPLASLNKNVFVCNYKSQKNKKVNLKESLKLITMKILMKSSQIQKENIMVVKKEKQSIILEEKNKKTVNLKKYQKPQIKHQQYLKGKSKQKKIIIKKQSQICLQIDSQPQFIKTINNVCQTPINQLEGVKEFVFHTKPRQINKNLKKTSQQSKETQNTFRQIKQLSFSHRKGGIKMTLSRKQNIRQQKDQQIHSINSRAFNQFTKNSKINNLQSYKQQQLQQNCLKQNKIIKSLPEIQTLCIQKTLKIKKDDFQKRKIQHQRRVKQFQIIPTN